MWSNIHTKYTNGSKVENIEVHLIKQAQGGDCDLEVIQLWSREKPKFLRHLTECIVRGTGIEPIENVTEKKNSWNLCYILPFSIQLVDTVVLIVLIIILVHIVVFNWFSITLLVCVVTLKV